MSNKVSNYPAAQKPKLTPEQMSELIESLDALRKMPPVTRNEPDKVRDRIDQYFRYCQLRGLRPTVEGLTLSLGVSRQSVWQWEGMGTEAGELTRRAKDLINAALTEWTLSGAINPIYSIWLQKCHQGYDEAQCARQAEIQPQPQVDRRTIEEIRERFAGLIDDDIHEPEPWTPE